MRLAGRYWALLLVVAHTGAAAAPCPPRGDASPAQPPHATHAAAEAGHAPASHHADHAPASHHADHAPASHEADPHPLPVAAVPDLAAACPCGCGDTAAPGGLGGRLGFGLLREPPPTADPARAPLGPARAPAEPAGPSDPPDPVPI